MPWSWSRAASVLYLEAPAGVGFSYSPLKKELINGDNQTAADNLAAIGKPPVVDGVSVDSPAERWRAAYEAYFPSKGLKAGVADLSMVEAEQFAEEAVDEMRRQKKMELERMRKEMEQEMLLSEGRK